MNHRFLNNEFWTLTFGAAFQRANIYLECEDRQKSDFKTSLRVFIEDNIYPRYMEDEISDDEHIANIYLISENSTNFQEILQGERLNFGVSQKLLNLFLKYKWSIAEISTPPHFPVDRRIQVNIGFRPILPWTRFVDHIDYMRIIDFVREINNTHPTIAHFELDHFERRVSTTNL
jgi:hypothetical protein